MNTEISEQHKGWSALIVILLSLILGIVWDRIFGDGPFFALGFALFIGLLLAAYVLLASVFRRSLDKISYLLFLPILFFSVMVFTRASELLTVLNVIGILLLLLLLALHRAPIPIIQFRLLNYLKVLLVPFRFIFPAAQTLSDGVAQFSHPRARQVLPRIVKGLLLAIPFIVIFLWLFSAADVEFERFLGQLIDIDPEILKHVVIIALVTLVLIGAYAFIFRTVHAAAPEQSSNQHRLLGTIEATTILVTVSFVFALFLGVHLTQFLRAGANVPELGLTYAEYARSGFAQLIVASVIAFLLLWAMEGSIHRSETGHVTPFKFLSGLLVGFVYLIMVSAFMRLWFYEEAYGFTTLRLYSHLFIVWLAVVFGILLYKIFADSREPAFAGRIVICVILFLAVLNILNPDAFIARHNFQRYQAIDKLDIFYLMHLSTDAVPEAVRELETLNGERRYILAQWLYNQHVVFEDMPAPWWEFHIANDAARRAIKESLPTIEQYNQRTPFTDFE